MKVHTDSIMEEYHRRRAEEHFPTQYFIDEKYLDVSRVAFSRIYHSWRKIHDREIYLISTDMYLEWLSNHFSRSPDPTINYWNNIKKMNGNLSSSLITAMSIFSMFYPDVSLNSVCGGSKITLSKHVRFLKSLNDGKTGESISNIGDA